VKAAAKLPQLFENKDIGGAVSASFNVFYAKQPKKRLTHPPFLNNK
jgi:hypothetical protein